MSANPFFHRGPVRDKSYFFGREYETTQMLSLLGNGQSVSVVGQRRIGKTSLLFHLADAQIFTQYGLKAGEHLFVYIDCGGLSNLDPPKLYRLFLEEIDEALAEIAPAQRLEIPGADISYRNFERILRQFIRQNRKPIIILDEFEQMSRNPHLDPDFFSGLRALTAKYPLAFVTASKYPLLNLTYANASALSSPFFNIFAGVRLSLFSDAQAREVIINLAQRGQANFDSDTVAAILALAGPHPLFLQIAAFHAFELWPEKAAGFENELRRRFLASAQEHFGYYWLNLSEAEQRVLAALPSAQAGQPEIIRRLEQGCLILRRDEGYDYLSPAFRDYVQAQPLSGLLQAGPLAIDVAQRLVLLRGHPLELSPTQYTLLAHLVERAGQVVTPEALEQAIWGDEYIEDPERLKSVIKGLRRALGDEASRLENVRGVGYMWRI